MSINRNGNIGIGTDNPGAKLEVNGDILCGDILCNNGNLLSTYDKAISGLMGTN